MFLQKFHNPSSAGTTPKRLAKTELYNLDGDRVAHRLDNKLGKGLFGCLDH